MSRNQRLALLGLAVVVVVVGFIIIRPGSDDSSSSTTTTAAAPQTVVVQDGKPVGGVKKLEFRKGGTIDFKVQATAPGGEVHFHGYDVHETVPAAGGTVRFKLPAKIDGIFVVEMEDSGEQIASVEVQQ
jgi:hypothetical protein